MNSKVVTVIIIAVVVLLGGWWLLMRTDDTSAPSVQNEMNTPTSTQQTDASTDTDQPSVAATITYTDNGFEPKQTTVKSGDTIRITNNSQSQLSLSSDPHPTHTIQPELNVGNVEPGQSKTFVLTKTGTWGYHNHENSAHTASVTVE